MKQPACRALIALVAIVACGWLSSTHAKAVDEAFATPLVFLQYEAAARACAQRDDCITCVRSPDCGWCEKENRCLPGTVEEPAIVRGKRSLCLANPNLWHFEEGSCSAEPLRNRRTAPLTPDISGSNSGKSILDLIPSLRDAKPPGANGTRNGTQSATAPTAPSNASAPAPTPACKPNDKECSLKEAQKNFNAMTLKFEQLKQSLRSTENDLLVAQQTVLLLNASRSAGNSSSNATSIGAEADALSNFAKKKAREAELLKEAADKAKKDAEAKLKEFQDQAEKEKKQKEAAAKKKAEDDAAAASKAAKDAAAAAEAAAKLAKDAEKKKETAEAKSSKASFLQLSSRLSKRLRRRST